MNFLSRIVEAVSGELVKGYRIDESLGVGCMTQGAWRLCPASRTRDGAEASALVLRKAALDKNGSVCGEIAAKIRDDVAGLVRIRHPSFLSVLEPLYEDSKVIVCVVEKVEWVLAERLRGGEVEGLIQDEEVVLGARDLLQAMVFLHETMGSAHLNISPENVFSAGGRWKLGGMAFLSAFGGGEEKGWGVEVSDNTRGLKTENSPATDTRFEVPTKAAPNFLFSSPLLFSNPGPACDLYSFFLTLHCVFAGRGGGAPVLAKRVDSPVEARRLASSLLGPQHQAFLAPLPATLRTAASATLNSRRNTPHAARALLRHPFFDDPTSRALEAAELMPARPPAEQKEFLAAAGKLASAVGRGGGARRLAAAVGKLTSPALAPLVRGVQLRLLAAAGHGDPETR